jgi:flagellar basal body-associated protein FliL
MKKSIKIILLISILVIAIGIAFYIGRSLGEKEYFTNKRNKKDSYHKSMANPNFKLNQNANILMNMTSDDASNYGVNKETFDIMQDIIKNNEGPDKMINILKNNPKQATAIQTLILKNS